MFDDSENFKIVKYFDFDYVNNKFDRKCILKYVYIFKKTLIVWKNRKQKFVIIVTTWIWDQVLDFS